MKENKLGAYLTSFTEKDWTAYHKFSKSLYSNRSDCQLVIDYIKKHKSRYDPNYMDGEYLRKKIRPSANKQVFANVISNLCKHIEHYLTWAEVENDPMMKDTLLLQALGKRGLTTQFHKQKEKSKLKRDKMPIGLWNNYHEFMGEYLLYYCNMVSGIVVGKIALKKAFESIFKFNATLTNYLVLEMRNRSVLFNENWKREISKYSKNCKTDHRLSLIFGNLIKLKVRKDEQSYVTLLTDVKNSKLSQEIRYSITIHLLSYITHKRIKGDNSYKNKMLELQKYGLENKILFPSGKIPALRFLNIIHRACNMEEYQWANQFIMDYSDSVFKGSKVSIASLGKAQIASSNGDFETVLKLLSNIKYNTFDHETRAKWLILCANYELNKDNFEIIEYNIGTFKYFVKKNKKNATVLLYDSYLNTAKYLLSIAKNSNLDEILNMINNEKYLAHRNWLRSKAIEKIKKK